nr:component of SufBCD complex [Rubellimicrobium aerolatum]
MLDAIDLRSFSNVWFWIVVAVAWSSAGHWVLGVPYDMVLRARREGGQALADLRDLTRFMAGRIAGAARGAGLWLAGVGAFALTGLAVMGFWYGAEFAQALCFLGVPLAGVAGLTVRAAQRIEAEEPEGEELARRLWRLRAAIQGIGLVAIFATATHGMARNLLALQGL